MELSQDISELSAALKQVLPPQIADSIANVLVPVFVDMINRHAPENEDEQESTKYDGIAASLDYEKLAKHIDNDELAGEIDLNALANEIDMTDLANEFDEDELVDQLKKAVVVEHIEPELIHQYVKDRLQQGMKIEVTLEDD
jgi:hypothetical protein